MSDRPAAPARRGENRSWFERFVSGVQDVVSHPSTFAVVTLVVLAWFVSAPLWYDLHEWQIAIHTVSSVVALLLLVLLRNAGQRAEEAENEKLNVLAEGLAALMESRGADDPALFEAAERLRSAIGLEQRH
jgi:low affinity Fe/Cu permease